MASPTPPLVTLEPLQIASIPTSGPELTAFLTQVISESFTIISQITSSPVAPWVLNSTKQSSTHDAVQLSARDVDPKFPNEHWFARRSVHELGDGLRWEEFTGNLLRNHAENEAHYIPSVKKVSKVTTVEWDLKGMEIDGWKDLELGVYGLHHSLPWPLTPRVFTILLLLAESTTTSEFLVISIPVTLPPDTKSTTGELVLAKTIVGRYVAVERVKVLPLGVEGSGKGKGDSAEWTTATASNAEGNLPMSVQKMSIPGAILKDVGCFLKWLETKRT